MKIILTFIFYCLPIFIIAQSSVTFILKDIPDDAAGFVGIRGNTAPLSWHKSIALEKAQDWYQIQVDFDKEVEKIEFKFVLEEDEQNPIWENTQNRDLQIGTPKKIVSRHQWNVEQLVDIRKLPKIQPEALMADYQLIETMVLDVHPGTYRYNDKASIRKALDELKVNFQRPLTHGEAYLAMSKLTASLQCDHTKVGFNNQNKIINSVIHRQADKLPFTFKWIEDRMIVNYDATQAKVLPRGSEVRSINGTDVMDIRNKMRAYIAADGATEGNRIIKMQVDGYDFRYNAFDVFYPLLYPLDTAELSLQVQPSNSKTLETIRVKTLTREGRSEILAIRYADFSKTRDDMWRFEITNNNVGILTLNSFGLMGWKRMTIDYKQFLADAFSALKEKKVENLIVDIRENTGGNDEMKDELFSYFNIDKSQLKVIEREGRTRYTQFPETLKPYIQTWGDNPWYYDLEPDRIDVQNGYYIFEEKVNPNSYNQKKNVFKGKVYLLTSANNTSLAFYTAKDFKKYKVGTIVGQETGGNLNDINGGQILFLRLPNSQIEIDFPVMGGFTILPQPNQGVQPNVELIPSLEDISSGKDSGIETIKMLIEQ